MEEVNKNTEVNNTDKKLHISGVKGSLNDVLSDLARLSTDLYMGEDVYNSKDGDNLKYREQVNDIHEKVKVILNYF
jgi:hypothetical protein